MRQRVFLLGSGLFLPFLISCGGGGGAGGLSGVMNVASFVIPAGETRTVTGDLVVNSVADLVIDGKLKVTPGARVALYSDADVKIHGPISTAPSRGRVSRQTDAPAVPGDLIIVGQNVTITETDENGSSVLETDVEGGGIFVTTWGGDVTISRNLVTKHGRDVFGDDAGHIHIGSIYANMKANADGRTGATTPNAVTITSTLTTGRGGHGITDTTGRVVDDVLRLASTSGGKGGSIAIVSVQAPTPPIRMEQIVLGRGGNAGSCGAAEAPVRAKSGSIDGEAGQSISVSLATEGRGGELYIISGNAEVVPLKRAEKGLAGNVYVAAGNGGPGGKGGDTKVRVTSFAREDLLSMPSQIHLENGGNGGTAIQQFRNGGSGGNVIIEVEGDQDPPTIHSVTLRNYGNGAPGFSGCSTTPTGPGSSGGKGGSLTVPASVTHTVQNCFVGGNAADGKPAGVKGAGGTFTRDGTRYPDGSDAGSCSAVNSIRFSETEVRLFTNEEKTVTLTRTGRLAQAGQPVVIVVRSEDGRVVNIRANGTVAKSHTITWPVGQTSLTLGIVGGVQIGNDPDVVATIASAEFGAIEATLEVNNSQQLTTVVPIQLIDTTTIPIGTVLSYKPDGVGRVATMRIVAPNSACSSWHAQKNTSGYFVVDGQVGNPTEENPCGFGPVIQPTGPTDP
ncbi:MAG: hypothetical protein QM758_28120 [Armatimonas sp.]